MHARELVLRCYAERTGILWNAYCLDLSLASQGESLDEVMAKLEAQINEYVTDALGGQDSKHAVYLMTRRAPLSMWLGYYSMKFLVWMLTPFGGRLFDERKRFKKVMPLEVARCN